VGPSTLHGFLLGATPHPAIRTRILRWYAREPDGDATGRRAALDVLLCRLAQERRPAADAAVLALVADLHRDAGVDVPTWAESIRPSERHEYD
jgi:hypothetical protein